MEAGTRCFDMRVPEEINRRIVDHTADINLTYSDAHSHASLPVIDSTWMELTAYPRPRQRSSRGSGLRSQRPQRAARLAVILGATCFGFLRWNWPAARIFMGDAGSGYLGYVTAVLALATREDPVAVWVWLIVGEYSSSTQPCPAPAPAAGRTGRPGTSQSCLSMGCTSLGKPRQGYLWVLVVNVLELSLVRFL